MPSSMQDYYLYALLLLYPAWRMFRRAGLKPWLSLVMLVPGLGVLAAAAILAFKPWPNARGGRP